MVGYAYIFAAFFYIFVGVCGSIGIIGRTSEVLLEKRQKIMDFFPVAAW